ncbi:MAG: DUF5615 family PIN-like protein [Promethearchaeota archaeon]
MNFIADECVDQQIVEKLRDSGHSVKYIWEEARGITDDEIIALARSENSIIVTMDEDFGELVFRQGKSSHGVILIRLHGLNPEKKRGEEMVGNFTVISPNLVRIRNLH